MSVTEQQLSSFLGEETNLGTVQNLKESFAKLASLLPFGHQHRLKEVNNCIIPTVECDLANSRIIIHNWPGEDVESLVNSPIHRIVEQKKDLFAYGDTSGRTGIAKKLSENQELQNNSYRLCVTFLEKVKGGGLKNSPTPNGNTDGQPIIRIPVEERAQYDIKNDGHTAIITFVVSSFKKGKGQPQRFTPLRVTSRELDSLRQTLANSDVMIEVIDTCQEGDMDEYNIHIVKPLDAQEIKDLLDVFVELCSNEIRAYIENAYRIAAAEHTFPDFRETYATDQALPDLRVACRV